MTYCHGLKKHPFYSRWSGMIQRCYNASDPDFKEHGGKLIEVDRRWDRRNKEGVTNFITWMENQVKKLPKGTDLGNYKVMRRNKLKNFSPRNCYLATSCEFAQKRPSTVLSVDLVIRIRRYMKEDPFRTFPEVAIKFDVSSPMAVYRCAQGLTWKNVDAQEAPIPSVTLLRERTKNVSRCQENGMEHASNSVITY